MIGQGEDGTVWTAVPSSESPDSNVEKLREMLLQRSLKGLEKYGCTTDRTDLSRLQWLRHALEEGLDQCVYLMKLISDEEKAMEIERGKA